MDLQDWVATTERLEKALSPAQMQQRRLAAQAAAKRRKGSKAKRAAKATAKFLLYDDDRVPGPKKNTRPRRAGTHALRVISSPLGRAALGAGVSMAYMRGPGHRKRLARIQDKAATMVNQAAVQQGGHKNPANDKWKFDQGKINQAQRSGAPKSVNQVQRRPIDEAGGSRTNERVNPVQRRSGITRRKKPGVVYGEGARRKRPTYGDPGLN